MRIIHISSNIQHRHENRSRDLMESTYGLELLNNCQLSCCPTNTKRTGSLSTYFNMFVGDNVNEEVTTAAIAAS
jgi:hypothetical protein